MSNPILNDDRFAPQERILDGEPMTINGTVNKIFLLFICLLAGCALSVYYLFTNPTIAGPLAGTGAVLAFIAVIICCFNVKATKYLAAPYALFEGLALGSISAMFESAYHGIVTQAILATFVVLFVMLGLYKAKMIRYTEKFQAVLTTAMLSILAIYVIQFIAMFFFRSIPLIWESGIVGIGFSLFVVIIGAMSLIQDFFFIESSSERMLSKDYEWFGAMGLMITLVWLYTEILRLLAKLNSRN